MAAAVPLLALVRDVPKRIHVAAWREEVPVKLDPVLGISKPVHELILTIDQEDGVETRKELVVTAAGLQVQLLPFLASGAYRGLDFVLIKRGGAFRTTFQIEVFPLF